MKETFAEGKNEFKQKHNFFSEVLDNEIKTLEKCKDLNASTMANRNNGKGVFDKAIPEHEKSLASMVNFKDQKKQLRNEVCKHINKLNALNDTASSFQNMHANQQSVMQIEKKLREERDQNEKKIISMIIDHLDGAITSARSTQD